MENLAKAAVSALKLLWRISITVLWLSRGVDRGNTVLPETSLNDPCHCCLLSVCSLLVRFTDLCVNTACI